MSVLVEALLLRSEKCCAGDGRDEFHFLMPTIAVIFIYLRLSTSQRSLRMLYSGQVAF